MRRAPLADHIDGHCDKADVAIIDARTNLAAARGAAGPSPACGILLVLRALPAAGSGNGFIVNAPIQRKYKPQKAIDGFHAASVAAVSVIA